MNRTANSARRACACRQLVVLVALAMSACAAKMAEPPAASPPSPPATTSVVPTPQDDGIVLHDKTAPALLDGPSIKQPRALAAGQWDSPKQMWEATCAPCHLGGVGPPLFGRGKPVDFLVARARNGHEAMPPFLPSEYSDDDLKRLAEWIQQQPAPAKGAGK
jgi:cytochrome c5